MERARERGLGQWKETILSWGDEGESARHCRARPPTATPAPTFQTILPPLDPPDPSQALLSPPGPAGRVPRPCCPLPGPSTPLHRSSWPHATPSGSERACRSLPSPRQSWPPKTPSLGAAQPGWEGFSCLACQMLLFTYLFIFWLVLGGQEVAVFVLKLCAKLASPSSVPLCPT